MNFIIESKQLSYFWGQQKILDKISLEVPPASVYGFLGPNGAGKTTTIKILLGLLPIAAGDVKIFGEYLRKDRIGILRRIGSLIEQPALYEHLSGRENMQNRARLLEQHPKCVDELLDLVQLTRDAHKKAGEYSLGMKQRLGIALSLIGNPELLILDEPTNGLDPNGIIEIRNLLKNLVEDHQKTVFVSSHLLAEVEKIATHVGILDRGQLLFQGTLSDLLGQTSDVRAIWTNASDRAQDVLSKRGFQSIQQGEWLHVSVKDQQDIAHLNALLVHADIQVFAIEKVHVDLENRFLHITRS